MVRQMIFAAQAWKLWSYGIGRAYRFRQNLALQMKGHSLRLQDKVAVVTGAGTGIGQAIALAFAEAGAAVVVDYVGSCNWPIPSLLVFHLNHVVAAFP
jgi:3-oxoacyl-ACP reductase-like protein